MPIVHYMPKSSPSPLPFNVTFSTDEYSIALHDGLNDLTNEQIGYLKSNPDVQNIYKHVIHFDASNSIAIAVSAAQVPTDSPALPPSDLSEVKGDDLDTTIDSTTDISTLERWLAAEQRTTVKRKLNERIGELKGG